MHKLSVPFLFVTLVACGAGSSVGADETRDDHTPAAESTPEPVGSDPVPPPNPVDPGPTDPPPPTHVPGDGVCSGPETPATTPQDCQVTGDGLCTGNESPANAPDDCDGVAGDGLCTGTETAQNTPVDCPQVAGDGLCTHSEHAANTPLDCPTVAGDGHCTGSENALTSPVDCPTVLGDGLCTGNETPANARADCPAPDVTFAGGTLAALREQSPTLYFGQLTLTGKLDLQSTDGEVVLNVDALTITDSARVDFKYAGCEYSDAPSLTVVSLGSITVNGPIDLGGRSGVSTTTSATCNDCRGTGGGDVTLIGSRITVTSYIHTYGGGGAQERDIIGGTLFIWGCRGASAGSQTLDAGTLIDIDSGNFDVSGGRGGLEDDGTRAQGGADGAMVWLAPNVDVDEIEMNHLPDLAQDVSLSDLTIDGHINGLDADGRFGQWTVSFQGGQQDVVEDMYRLHFPGPARNVTLRVSAADTSVDIDTYLFDSSGNQVLQWGTTPNSTETLTHFMQPGDYLLGVSVWSRVLSDYTVALSP